MGKAACAQVLASKQLPSQATRDTRPHERSGRGEPEDINNIEGLLSHGVSQWAAIEVHVETPVKTDAEPSRKEQSKCIHVSGQWRCPTQ
jgi:hypothetical protein